MLGFGNKDEHGDSLTIQLHVLASSEAFALAQKIWNENSRTLYEDKTLGKEFLHFGYVNPSCTVWLQRDKGRTDIFELIVRWETSKMHEVFAITNTAGQPSGSDQRAKALLNSMLITPSIVLSKQ